LDVSLYYDTNGNLEEIDDALYALWVSSGNPKASHWTLQPPPPPANSATLHAVWSNYAWSIVDIPVPESVPAHHLMQALITFGMYNAVETYMAGLAALDPMNIGWTKAPYFRRDAVGINNAAEALELSTEQVDALFRYAGALVT